MTGPIQIGNLNVGRGFPLVIIAGPCVIEDQDSPVRLASYLKKETEALGLGYIFKASYDKANRTSIKSFRGPGLDEGLRILETVRRETGALIMSDVHETAEVEAAAQVLDIIQIPAFLCRQTRLLQTAARTGRAINVKKGQFLSPWDAAHVLEKVVAAGNERVMITERGTSFGYNNLVVDMRSLAIMREFGRPVIFDATHSVQLPGGGGGCSGGDRAFIPPLARAATAVGVDGVFMEVHFNPDRALCDGPNSLPAEFFPSLIKSLAEIDRLIQPD
ncbi:MAG: 3-deoxy-8-phosphooctulonate synthase [Pseudomonadota bacterium]